MQNEQIIPLKIHQIWIGDQPAPQRWLQTWKSKNPSWEYIFWDNEKVFGRKWKNQEMIDFYLGNTNEEDFTIANGYVYSGRRAKYFQWHIISDIITYEILLEEGGYLPGADSECVKSIDDKFGKEGIYIVNTGHLYAYKYEAEKDPVKKKRYQPENASPITASIKGHWFLEKCVEELSKRNRGEAVDTTGNVFMGDMIRQYGTPEDARVVQYKPRNRREVQSYSIHHSGTMTGSYNTGI